MKKTKYVKLTHYELELLKRAYTELSYVFDYGDATKDKVNKIFELLPETLLEKLCVIQTRDDPKISVAESILKRVKYIYIYVDYGFGHINPSYPLKELIEDAETIYSVK